MKNFLISICFGILLPQLWPVQSHAQSLDIALGYQNGSPLGNMGYTIRRMHTMQMGLYYKPRYRLSYGIELGIGGHGNSSEEITLTYNNGSTGKAEVLVNNNIFNAVLALNYHFLNGRAINPYATMRGGYTRYATKLTLNDAEETDADGNPLNIDTEKLVSDHSFVYGIGAGIRFDLAFLFGVVDRNQLFVDFSMNYMRGGSVKYMSERAGTRRISSPNGIDDIAFLLDNPDEPTIESDYHSGLLYRSDINYFDFRIGIVFRPYFGTE